MTSSHTPTAANHLLDQAEKAASGLQASVRGTVSEAQSHVDDAVQHLGSRLTHLAEQVGHLSREGVHAAQSGTRHFGERMHDASDAAQGYIRKEPVKAVLLAAGIGVVVVGLFSLLVRGNHRSR